MAVAIEMSLFFSRLSSTSILFPNTAFSNLMLLTTAGAASCILVALMQITGGFILFFVSGMVEEKFFCMTFPIEEFLEGN